MLWIYCGRARSEHIIFIENSLLTDQVEEDTLLVLLLHFSTLLYKFLQSLMWHTHRPTSAARPSVPKQPWVCAGSALKFFVPFTRSRSTRYLTSITLYTCSILSTRLAPGEISRSLLPRKPADIWPRYSICLAKCETKLTAGVHRRLNLKMNALLINGPCSLHRDLF